MTEHPPAEPVQRIVVALDASPQSLVALEIAAEMATRFQAELVCVYVEDINLIRLSAYPFLREISLLSCQPRALDSLMLERQLHAHARFIQRTLSTRAARSNLKWSFQVRRGLISGELLLAAEESDLIILGKSGWSGRRVPGSTAQSILQQASQQAIIMAKRPRSGSPILVAYDSSKNSQKALAAAQRLRFTDNPMIVLLLAETEDKSKLLREEVENTLAQSGIAASYRWAPAIDGSQLALLVQRRGADMAVLPGGSRFLPPETLLTMLHESDCAVLVVR